MWRRLWEYYFQLILFTDLCLFSILLTSVKVNAAICKCQPSIKQTWLTRKGLKTTWHCPGNTNWRGRLSTVDLFIEVACFVDKVNNIFIIKSSRSKLVSTRRSTVLSPPLQLVFPGLFISNKEKDFILRPYFYSHERAVSNLDRSMNISLWV
jgi:hypothetical protein